MTPMADYIIEGVRTSSGRSLGLEVKEMEQVLIRNCALQPSLLAFTNTHLNPASAAVPISRWSHESPPSRAR
jgi:hypothetical protein